MITEAEVEQQVREVLVSEFEIEADKIKPEADLFAELELDSIDAVDLMVRLQQRIGKRVEPDDFRQIHTLRDVIVTVTKLAND